MYDLIIIGAGPSGLTAALYAGRYRLKTLVLEKMVVGGQIVLSDMIENYPGFPGGITTQELIERFKRQVDDLGIEIITADATGVERIGEAPHPAYRIKTAEKDFEGRSIIIAAGAHWKRLGVPSEERLIGKGVSYCATCDGPFFRNKEVVVVGGGDKAIEEAIFLTRYASQVTIIHRRKELRATEILQEKARNNPKIRFVLDSKVEEIIGQSKVEAVRTRDNHRHEEATIPCQGVFIFIGIRPSTEFLKNVLAMDETGFIITDEKMQTSLEGVYACGDCREKNLYQVIIGCGEGAVAAHAVHAYLLNR